jgi:predicted RNase H-like HicB family nuclease
MSFQIEVEQEHDGRCLAEIPQLPGTLAYGDSAHEAVQNVQALGLRVFADRIEHGEAVRTG